MLLRFRGVCLHILHRPSGWGVLKMSSRWKTYVLSWKLERSAQFMSRWHLWIDAWEISVCKAWSLPQVVHCGHRPHGALWTMGIPALFSDIRLWKWFQKLISCSFFVSQKVAPILLIEVEIFKSGRGCLDHIYAREWNGISQVIINKWMWWWKISFKLWMHCSPIFGLIVNPLFFTRIRVDCDDQETITSGGIFGFIVDALSSDIQIDRKMHCSSQVFRLIVTTRRQTPAEEHLTANVITDQSMFKSLLEPGRCSKFGFLSIFVMLSAQFPGSTATSCRGKWFWDCQYHWKPSKPINRRTSLRVLHTSPEPEGSYGGP